MKTIIFAAALAATTLHAQGYLLPGPRVPAPPATMPGEVAPAFYPQGDPAETLWREARRAIAEEEWETAISDFAKVRSSYPRSAYIGDSYYWQAWALRQKGTTTSLRQATTLLETQRDKYGGSATMASGESSALLTRIRGLLARSGDAQAAESITKRAGQAAGAGSGSSSSSSFNNNPGAGDNSGQNGRRGPTTTGRNIRTAQSSSSGCKNENDDERVMALNALLQMNSDDALPLLKQVLAKRETCSEILRRKAVFLVSQKRGSEAADILLATAENDPDQETREQAVFWLSQVDSDRSVKFLEQILKTSKDENMQEKAIFSLQNGHSDRGLAILRDYANREDVPENLRENAVFWIGQRKSDENAQFLRNLFTKTKNPDLREKIIFSISQTNQPGNAQFLLDQALNSSNSIDVRKNALFWASQSNAVDVAKLGELYDKAGDADFREQVIFALSQKGRNSAAVDKLIDIAKTEKNRDLREKAVFWLGQSRDPRALKALQEIILKSPE
jgi:HEAT repeat protein